MASHPPIYVGIVPLNSGYTACRFYDPGEDIVYVGKTPLGRRTDWILGVSHGYIILGCLGGGTTIVNPLTGEIKKDWFPRSSSSSRRGIDLNTGSALLSSPPTSPAGCVLVEWDKRNIQYCRPGDKRWCQVVLLHDHRLPRRPARHRDGGVVLSVAVVGGKGYVLIEGVGLGSFDLTAGAQYATVTSTALPQEDMTVLPREDKRRYSSRFLAEHNGELFSLPVAAARYSGGWVAEDVPVVVSRFDASISKWVVLDDVDDLGGRWCSSVIVDSSKRAIFVEGDSMEKWRWGSSNWIYTFHDGYCRKYKLNQPSSHPALSIPFALYFGGLHGFWVLPKFLLSPMIHVDE